MGAPAAAVKCKYENRPYELGDVFRDLKQKQGEMRFQNGVALGTFFCNGSRLLGCSERNCPYNELKAFGINTCTVLCERIMD